MSNVNIEEQLDTDRVVCPVVRPLVLLVRAAHQRPLQVVHVGGAGVVEVPAAGLTRPRTRGRPAIITLLYFHISRICLCNTCDEVSEEDWTRSRRHSCVRHPQERSSSAARQT